jgi:hypothetical protein
VHPFLIDRGEGKIQLPGRLAPLTAIHSQQRELGFADDGRIRVARGGRSGRRFDEKALGVVGMSC